MKRILAGILLAAIMSPLAGCIVYERRYDDGNRRYDEGNRRYDEGYRRPYNYRPYPYRYYGYRP